MTTWKLRLKDLELNEVVPWQEKTLPLPTYNHSPLPPSPSRDR